MSTGVWTNNWRAAKNLMLLGHYIYGLTTLIRRNGYIQSASDGTGAVHNIYSPMGPYMTGNSGWEGWAYCRFGSGSTSPSASDYRLESMLSHTDIVVDNVYNVSETVSGSTVTRTVKYVLRNPSDSASITVREWGIFLSTGYTGSGYVELNNDYLVYREVLDSDVVLAAHQSATLTLTVSMTLDDPVPDPNA